MTVTYLKKATKTPASETGTARKVVDEMLATIEQGGEHWIGQQVQLGDPHGPVLSQGSHGALGRHPLGPGPFRALPAQLAHVTHPGRTGELLDQAALPQQC